jgi:single-stranded DNA-binding protein
VNKVLLSGKVGKAPEVAYTPKGKKIVMFPLVVGDDEFSIDVVGAGESVPARLDQSVGNSVLVAGELVKAKLKSRDVLRVKASKILWMEE